jgi:hypothetical protein
MGPIVVLALGAAVFTNGAWAHDHDVPRAKLRVNGQVKHLSPWI